jgi:hypothetical protein
MASISSWTVMSAEGIVVFQSPQLVLILTIIKSGEKTSSGTQTPLLTAHAKDQQFFVEALLTALLSASLVYFHLKFLSSVSEEPEQLPKIHPNSDALSSPTISSSLGAWACAR